MCALCLLHWDRLIVVSLNVELANGTGAAATEEPFVDAVRVEVVEAGHRANTLSIFVVHDANHAFLIRFIFLLFQEILSYLSFRKPEGLNEGVYA